MSRKSRTTSYLALRRIWHNTGLHVRFQDRRVLIRCYLTTLSVSSPQDKNEHQNKHAKNVPVCVCEKKLSLLFIS